MAYKPTAFDILVVSPQDNNYPVVYLSTTTSKLISKVAAGCPNEHCIIKKDLSTASHMVGQNNDGSEHYALRLITHIKHVH